MAWAQLEEAVEMMGESLDELFGVAEDEEA